MNTKYILIAVAILALLGLADSAYLSYAALKHLPLPCTILDGCNEVARSPYSKVYGIPLALFGVAFYAGIVLLALFSLLKPKKIVFSLLKLAALAGFLLSAYFLYIQAFKIHAFCIYCIASAIFATAIFAASFWLKPSSPSQI